GGGDRGGRLREARLRESSTGGRSLWLAGGRWLPPPTPPRHEGGDADRQRPPESLAPRGSPARGRRAESAGPPRGAPRGCRAGGKRGRCGGRAARALASPEFIRVAKGDDGAARAGVPGNVEVQVAPPGRPGGRRGGGGDPERGAEGGLLGVAAAVA